MTLGLTSASQKQQDEPVKVSVWVLDDFEIHPHSDWRQKTLLPPQWNWNATIFMTRVTKIRSQKHSYCFLHFGLGLGEDLNRTEQNIEEWNCALLNLRTPQFNLWKHIQTSTKAKMLLFPAKWKIWPFFPPWPNTQQLHPNWSQECRGSFFTRAFINNQQAKIISSSKEMSES